MTTDIIPHNIWELLKAFVKEKGTGSVILHIKNGVVLSGKVEQEFRALTKTE